MAASTLRPKGQVTIPRAIRAAAHLEEGDPLEIELTDDGILIRPKKLIDADQAWFWTPEWQQMEREADADLAAGRTRYFDSGDDLLQALKDLER